MKYISTRGNYEPVDSSEAIRLGMVPKGGLFVPEEIPSISPTEIKQMQNMTYQEIAFTVLKKYLTDYQEDEIKEALKAAYNSQNFNHSQIAPVKKLEDRTYILELWHGPTAAFKDMALQLMPHLLVQALEKQEIEEDIVILVATSGDTGKAALEGFRGVSGVEIIVFYPNQGVSKVQETQMVTTRGDNTAVVAVEGNFDNCQTQVKKVFADRDFNQLLAQKGFQFSSANSINWGRLVPQIVYYFHVYAELCDRKEISPGKRINLTVPTGNFGNILAAYYAYQMGLPVNRFICASNDNKILTDFLKTGQYDTEREFKKTISPSMDILISSNLERFLFEITGQDSSQINEWYDSLQKTGSFEIREDYLAEIQKIFTGEFAVESETRAMIRQVYENNNYTIDPHTGVGVSAYQKYRQKSKDQTPAVIASTASPYKFSRAVLEAIEGRKHEEDEFDILRSLQEKIEMDIHPSLKNLEEEKIRHNRKCGSEEIKQEIEQILDLTE